MAAIELGGAMGQAHVQMKSGRKYLFRFPLERQWICQSVLSGRYNWPKSDADAKVRRVLDLGAGCGEFMVHAWVRWPGCWVDYYEPDEQLARFAEMNAVPGSRRLPGCLYSDELEPYDVIRFATPWNNQRRIVIQDWVAYP
jgi:hypothetical protein